jgi:hypothetical protein
MGQTETRSRKGYNVRKETKPLASSLAHRQVITPIASENEITTVVVIGGRNGGRGWKNRMAEITSCMNAFTDDTPHACADMDLLIRCNDCYAAETKPCVLEPMS